MWNRPTHYYEKDWKGAMRRHSNVGTPDILHWVYTLHETAAKYVRKCPHVLWGFQEKRGDWYNEELYKFLSWRHFVWFIWFLHDIVIFLCVSFHPLSITENKIDTLFFLNADNLIYFFLINDIKMSFSTHIW